MSRKKTYSEMCLLRPFYRVLSSNGLGLYTLLCRRFQPTEEHSIGMINRIVSGGQTGVDRAALDFALQLGIECGGWVPKGRMAEDGVIPGRYPNLVETDSDDPNIRTEHNVRDSDSTLLITRGTPTGGSAFTVEVATRLGKPVFHLDLARESVEHVLPRLCQWLQDLHPAILNVAGPRASEDHEIYTLTKLLLEGIFLAMNSKDKRRTGFRL